MSAASLRSSPVTGLAERGAAGAVARSAARTVVGAPASRRGSLRIVPPGRSEASRTPFLAVVVLVLAAGLLGLLALNTVLAQDAFQLHTLKTEGRELVMREQVLQREVESLRTPEALAERAIEMGMVPAGPPAFLRLSDGAVLGATPADEQAPIDPLDDFSGSTASEPVDEAVGADTADNDSDADASSGSESDTDASSGTQSTSDSDSASHSHSHSDTEHSDTEHSDTESQDADQ